MQHPDTGCHSLVVPTARSGITITETDELAATLDAAAQRWPEIRSRRELLLRLVREGRTAIAGDDEAAVAGRLAAIEHTRGALSAVYRPDEFARLRDDWPA